MIVERQPGLVRWGPPLGLCLTLFVVSYSVSVVPAIMPRIVRDLESSLGFIQGALVLLALVKASFAPSCENLIKRYGRKRIFMGGLGVFSLGAIATACSTNIGFFVAAYVLLIGLGSTPLLGSPRDLIERIYDDRTEIKAQLALIVFSILGGLAGAVLGGLIASVYGWRWSFLPELLLVPLIVFLVRGVPDSVHQPSLEIDWIGGLFSFFGFGFTLLGVSLAGEYGWWEPKERFTIMNVVIPPFTLSIAPPLIAVGVICLGIFVSWQRRQRHTGKITLMRVGLLRHAPFLLGMFTAALHTLITTGVQFNLYQFIPAVLQLNPFQTAIAVLPFSLAQLVVVIATTFKLVGRVSAKSIIYAGLTMFGVGVWGLYLAIAPTMSALSLLPALIVMGAGSGLFLAQIAITTFANVKPDNRAEASGIYSPVQNMGTALGRAILGTALITIASTRIVDKGIAVYGQIVEPEQRLRIIQTLTQVLQTGTAEERKAFFKNLPAVVQPSLGNILGSSAMEALQVSLLISLGFSVVCLLSAFLIPKRPIQQ